VPDAEYPFVGWVVDGKLVSTWHGATQSYIPHIAFAVKHPAKLRLTKNFVKQRDDEDSDDLTKRISDELFERGYLRGTRAFFKAGTAHFTVGTLRPSSIKQVQDFLFKNPISHKKVAVSGYFNDEWVELLINDFLADKPTDIYRHRMKGSHTYGQDRRNNATDL